MLAGLHVLLARLRSLFRADQLDADFAEELQAHLELAEAERIRQGMAPAEARRAARLELGGVTQLREAHRAARGLPWLDSLRIDVRLGLRMLRRSWGLTVVGGLAITLTIAVAVAVFTFLDLAFGRELPLDEGTRVVAVHTWDTRAQRRAELALADVERWRSSARSLTSVGAFRTVERRLEVGGSPTAPASDGGDADWVRVAEMTPSGFELARVPAQLGRTLLVEDAAEDAPPVVVLGHEVWRRRFGEDPGVLGRSLRLDGRQHTIVGVMPAGFGFPVNHHFWTVLRVSQPVALPPPPDAGVFARLAAGTSLEEAQADLAALGLLPGEGSLDRPLQLRAVPYPLAFTGDLESTEARWLVGLALLFVTLLLVPPCANIAILVYARTLSRQEELSARHALGASRQRIVGQLFVEMLVLSAAAAGLALLAVRAALRWAESKEIQAVPDGLPFWVDFGLPTGAVVFALLLALLAALIAGLVPALRATGNWQRVGVSVLGQRATRRLGPGWTALVVAQVALCMAVLPLVAEVTWGTIRTGLLGPGFPAEEYLTARLSWSAGARSGLEPADPLAAAAVTTEVVRRIGAEPGVRGVTVAAAPGTEPWQRIALEPTDRGPAIDALVRVSPVDEAFFGVFEIPLLAGRHLEPADFSGGKRVVVVNRTLATKLSGTDSPLGRRLRLVSTDEALEPGGSSPHVWHEIVGVVEDRPTPVDHGTLYHPAAPGTVSPARLAVRAAGASADWTPRLRALVAAVDPELRLDEVQPLPAIYRAKEVANNIGASTLAAAALSVLLLSAAGMYALMSFTLNLRRQEIGIRAALGAQPWRLLTGVFLRAGGQLGMGALLGILVAQLLDQVLPAEKVGGWPIPGILALTTGFMLLIGLLAALGPARRGLEIDPMEELRGS